MPWGSCLTPHIIARNRVGSGAPFRAGTCLHAHLEEQLRSEMGHSHPQGTRRALELILKHGSAQIIKPQQDFP